MARRKSDLAYKVRGKKNLRSAWAHVCASAKRSSDLEIRREAARFGQDAERNLARLQDQLRNAPYRFKAGRGFLKTRKGKTPRPLVVSTIGDRVVRRAILQTLIKCESVRDRLATGASYGGLRKVGVPEAISAACSAIDSGAGYYLKTDIADFYTSVPRHRALEVLKRLLPDRSINSLLEDATLVELEDLDQLGEQIKLFPSYEIGIAQGSCLSPLLGNLLLAKFDGIVLSQDVQLLRYIDDVLILGPSRETVRRAFTIGLDELRDLGLTAYSPGDGSNKASEGGTRRPFDYLGCTITPKAVRPSLDSQNRVRGKIERVIQRSVRAMCRGTFEDPVSYDLSLVSTLDLVSNIAMGWSNQYAFCNAPEVMSRLDGFVDREIGKYLGTYGDRRKRVDALARRRMLGVRLFSDGNKHPIRREAAPAA